MSEYVREYVGKYKFDDYVDKDGNTIQGAEIELYRTYPKYLVAALVYDEGQESCPLPSSK